MGIEFIRNASGEPSVKRWAKGLDRTKTPTLMDVSVSEASRTLTVKLTSMKAVCEGATVLVQSKGPDLVVFDGLRQVGSIADPPDSVRTALATRHGMVRAVVERVGVLGTTVEIKLP